MNEDLDPIKPKVLKTLFTKEVPNHIIPLGFHCDDDSKLFRYWWKLEGYLLFKKYVEDMNYEPVQEGI